jgi:hypothetical protein
VSSRFDAVDARFEDVVRAIADQRSSADGQRRHPGSE